LKKKKETAEIGKKKKVNSIQFKNKKITMCNSEEVRQLIGKSLSDRTSCLVSQTWISLLMSPVLLL